MLYYEIALVKIKQKIIEKGNNNETKPQVTKVIQSQTK